MPFQFRGQRADEDIILFTRHHPVYLAETLFFDVLIGLIPWIWFVFASFNLVFFYILGICTVFVLIRFGLAWYKWFNSIMVVTNQRIIMVRQKGVTHVEISECTLGSIQQINHKIRGILGTVFGYGDMEISLGGSQQPMTIHNVPDPYEIQQDILQVQNSLSA